MHCHIAPVTQSGTSLHGSDQEIEQLLWGSNRPNSEWSISISSLCTIPKQKSVNASETNAASLGAAVNHSLFTLFIGLNN